jgi:O-antigen ligase
MSLAALALSVPVIVVMILSIYLRPVTIIGLFLVCSVYSNPYIVAIALAIIMGVSCFRYPKLTASPRNSGVIWFAVFWFFCAIFVSLSSGAEGRFVTELLQLFLGLMLMIFVILKISSLADLNRLLYWLMIGSCLNSILFVVLYYLRLDLNVIAMANTVNYLSFVLLIGGVAIPLCLAKGLKSWLWTLPLVSLSLCAIFLTESRASTIMAFGCVGYRVTVALGRGSSLLGFRSIFALLVLILIGYIFRAEIAESVQTSTSVDLLSVLDLERNHSNLERVRMLVHSFNLLKESPLGHGLGTSSSLFSNVSGVADHPHPHNTLALYAVELGCFGLVIYFVFVYFLLRSIFLNPSERDVEAMNQQRKTGVLVAFCLLVFSVYEAVFFNGVLIIHYMALSGMVFAIRSAIVRERLYVA